MTLLTQTFLSSLYPAMAIRRAMYVGVGEFVIGEKACAKEIQHSNKLGYHILSVDKKATSIDGIGNKKLTRTVALLLT